MASKGTKIVISILLTVATLFVAYRFISAFFIIYIETQAEKEMEIGNYEEAVDKLLLSQKFLFPGETTENNSSLLGSCYLELGMYEEAITRFKEAIDENGKDNEVIYYTNIGIAYAQLGDYNNALMQYAEALKLDPNYAELNSSLGSLYIRLEEPQLSIVYFKKAINQDPSLATAYGNCAYAYALTGDFDRAREYLEKSISRGYNNADIIRELIYELEQESGL